MSKPKLNLPPRTCQSPACDKQLVRRPGEHATDWRLRRYCDLGCTRVGVSGPRNATPPPANPAPGWQDRAACRGTDEAWWTDSTSDVEEARLRGLAREFCAGCVVRGSCRMQGRRERFGLYGGVLWRTELGRPTQIDLLSPAESVAS